MSDLEDRLGAALARWVGLVARRPAVVVCASLALTVASLLYLPGHLGVNGDTDDLFDPELTFLMLREELSAALPAYDENLLVVVDAPSPFEAAEAAEAVALRAASQPGLFGSVYAPGVGPYFEQNGLLYLDVEELEDLADDLAAAQPFLAELSRDPSLRGVFAPLRQALEHGELPVEDAELSLPKVFEAVEAALEDAERLEEQPRSFGDLVLGDGQAGEPGRRYVIVKPVLDWGEFAVGAGALRGLREIFGELGLDGPGPTRARITGELALESDELYRVQRQAATAGLVSLVLVSAILGFALRSLRLVFATVFTLVCGLVWTAGFAAVSIGQLNLISVAFAVLFIGLGVDFAIHFCLRYRELLASGADHARALGETARSVGSSLVLCAVTTAIGFFAFAPTDYRGVAELGIVAGAGMLISLVGSLTLLPALMSLWLRPGPAPAGVRPAHSAPMPTLPVRHPALVCGVATVLALGSLFLLPRLHFDSNALNVRDPGSPPVQVFRELVEGGDINPWSIDVLVPDLAAGDALARRLEALPSVARAGTLRSYVPGNQPEKLAILADVDLFLGLADTPTGSAPTPAQELAAMRDFREALRSFEAPSPGLARAAGALGDSLDRFFLELQGAAGEEMLSALRSILVGSVTSRIDRLRIALTAAPVELTDLPGPLAARMLTADGRARVEVLPEHDLNEPAALRAFVREVRQIAPRATGPSVYQLDSAAAIVLALRQAFASAAVLVALLLFFLWRNLRDPSLVMTPLCLAALLTASVSVLAGLPINFADVIVLPLLLGIGIDSGIHLVHRRRRQRGVDLLATSTSQAVVFSALTTIASFGSLGFSAHRGLASLGQLLTLGVALTLVCTLFVLPALMALQDRRRGSGADGVQGSS